MLATAFASGATVNISDMTGKTVLHAAVEKGDLNTIGTSCCCCCACRDGSPNTHNGSMCVCLGGGVGYCLQTQRFDINMGNKQFHTPLMYAAMCLCKNEQLACQIIDILLQHGAGMFVSPLSIQRNNCPK